MTGRAVTGEIWRLRAHAIRRDLQVLGCDWRRVVAMRTPRAPLITHARMTMNALQDTKQETMNALPLQMILSVACSASRTPSRALLVALTFKAVSECMRWERCLPFIISCYCAIRQCNVAKRRALRTYIHTLCNVTACTKSNVSNLSRWVCRARQPMWNEWRTTILGVSL